VKKIIRNPFHWKFLSDYRKTGMNSFHSAISKHYSFLTRTMITFLHRDHTLFKRFLRIFLIHPIASFGYLYGKILGLFLEPAQALNVLCMSINFYEKGSGELPRKWRQYSHRFPQQSTHFIMYELNVVIRRWQPARLYELTYRYYKPDGRLWAESRSDWVIRSGAIGARVTGGRGWSDPGHWESGEYEVQLLLDRVEVGKSGFIIEPSSPPKPPPPPPKPPPPPAEVLHRPFVRFYASMAGRSQTKARQDSIRFPQQSTGTVICELTVRNLLYEQCDRIYPMTAQCYTPDGQLLWEAHCDWVIRSHEQEPSISWELWVSGHWRVGAYRVEILISGVEFAWGAFAIEA
jgi:hypothetical protein